MRKGVNGQAAALMVLPCLAWGFQQVSIKLIADDVSPMLQVALRSALAAALVCLFNLLVTRDRWVAGVTRAGAIVGVLFALEFLFVAEGLRWTSASHMSVFLYTAPLFAAIGLHWRLPEERMTRRQWCGMALAFMGLATTFLAPDAMRNASAANPDQLFGDLLGLCAGFSWGMTTVALRTSRLSDAPATQTLFYQLVGAAVLLLPLALATGRSSFHATPAAWASLGFQVIIASFAANFMWFWMLRKHFASQLGVLLFMSPLFGMGFGVLVLREELAMSFLIGAMLVLGGVLMVNSHGSLPEKQSPAG